MKTADRSNEVDVIRMAALIGICLVNVPFMALPVSSVLVPPDNVYEKFAVFLSAGFLQLKFFLLFSFIFGWGMGIQSARSVSTGQLFSKLYFQRMLGLAIIGSAHAILVFSGDILVLYAMAGSLMWLIKDYSPRQLMKFAACMLPVSIVLLTILAVLIDATTNDQSALFSELGGANRGGTFIDATRVRLAAWPVTVVFLIGLQGPMVLGAFAVGLAAAKTNFFSESSIGFRLLEKRLPLLLSIAVPLNIMYAAVASGILLDKYELLSLFGFVFIAIGAPSLAFVYLYYLIVIARKIKLPLILVQAGRNSLSSYVAQGVLSGLVFGAYGMGLFSSYNQLALLPIALIIAFLSMVFVGTYANIFGRGPLEPLLRKMSGS